MAEVGSAYVSILPSARGFGSKLNGEIGGDLDSAGKSAGSRFGNALKVGALAVVGAGILAGKFLKGTLDEAREAQVITARTENVIAKMGNAANISAAQVGKLAESISLKTGIDDEAIQSGQNLLLTFGKIRNEAGAGNDIFNRTSALMVDMSAAMGTDAKSSALQLGKALNDPIKGVTALTRAGVSFTEQQKAQITKLVESGRTLQAQKLILGEVEKQFGGAAEAMATPADKARVAWDNFREQIGTMLLPIVDKLLTTLTTSVIPAVSTFVAQIQSGTGAGGQLASVVRTIADNFDLIVIAIGSVTAGLGAYKAAMAVSAAITAVQTAGTTAATGATWSLNAALRANPIGIVVTAITLLVAGLVIAYKKSETFRNIVDQLWAAIKATAGWVVKVAGLLVGSLVTAVSAVIAVVVKVIAKVVDFGQTVVSAVQLMIGWVRDKASAAWESLKDKAVAAARAIIEPVQNVIAKVQGMADLVKGAAAGAWDGFKSAAVGAMNAIRTAVQWVIDKVQALIDKIQSIPGIPGGGASGNGTLVGGVPRTTTPRGIASPSSLSSQRFSSTSGESAVVAELRALRAAVYTVAPGVGKELNGAASTAQRRAS